MLDGKGIDFATIDILVPKIDPPGDAYWVATNNIALK